MKEKLRRKITVTSSLKEISTEQLRNRVVVLRYGIRLQDRYLKTT
jgi:hypothetical protein